MKEGERMPKLVKPYSNIEKLQELNRLELGTTSLCILFDCGRNKALDLKRQVKQKILESGKLLPHEDKVPTATAIRLLMIDETRIRKLAAMEMAEQQKRDTQAVQSEVSQNR